MELVKAFKIEYFGDIEIKIFSDDVPLVEHRSRFCGSTSGLRPVGVARPLWEMRQPLIARMFHARVRPQKYPGDVRVQDDLRVCFDLADIHRMFGIDRLRDNDVGGRKRLMRMVAERFVTNYEVRDVIIKIRESIAIKLLQAPPLAISDEYNFPHGWGGPFQCTCSDCKARERWLASFINPPGSIQPLTDAHPYQRKPKGPAVLASGGQFTGRHERSGTKLQFDLRAVRPLGDEIGRDGNGPFTMVGVVGEVPGGDQSTAGEDADLLAVALFRLMPAAVRKCTTRSVRGRRSR